jgi:hypothetical protein
MLQDVVLPLYLVYNRVRDHDLCQLHRYLCDGRRCE